MLNQPTPQRIRELRSMPYEEYLKTPEWASKRDQALKRDGYCCRACNSSEKLQVHHRTYERRGNEDLNDLTTLCNDCHEHFHEKISQDEIMGRTHPDPEIEEDASAKKKRQTQKREDYLIGMLVQNPNLYQHVSGILSESDLTGADASALYQLFGLDKPFEQCIPPDLETAVSRAAEIAKVENPLTEYQQVKIIIELATRLKHEHLLQSHEEARSLLLEATCTGDISAEKQSRQQIQEIDKKIQANAAIRRQLRG